METLRQLGDRHGTDKGANGYLDIYARYLDARRETVSQVLEIGVKQGASLKMWGEYFPNAQIHGLDVDPAVQKGYGPRISVTVGSQDDYASFARLPALDVIVDDASHVNTLTLAAWHLSWPLLRPGGLYIIEDLCISYRWARWSWPGMKHNRRDLNLTNDRKAIDEWLAQVVRKVDWRQGVAYVHSWPMLLIMEKSA